MSSNKIRQPLTVFSYHFSLVVTEILSWEKGEVGKGKAYNYRLSPLTVNLFPIN